MRSALAVKASSSASGVKIPAKAFGKSMMPPQRMTEYVRLALSSAKNVCRTRAAFLAP